MTNHPQLGGVGVDLMRQQAAKELANRSLNAARQQIQQEFAANITDSEKWTTDNEVPDPDESILPKPTGFRLLVRPLAAKTKSDGGVYLPDKAIDAQNYLQTFAKVLAIGPLAWNRNDYKMEGGWCKPGDIVMISRHSGAAIEIAGVRLKIIDDDVVHAIIPDYSKVVRF